jgi:membrane associated rhomboid family serine protease
MTDPTPPPLPEAPPSPYAILDGRGVHPVDRETLLRECTDGRIPRCVWTPEAPGGTPPEEVPYLMDAIRDRLAGSAKTQGIIVGFFVAVLAVQGFQSGDLRPGSPLLVYLSFGVVWAALRVREWRVARRLTPEGYREMVRRADETAAVYQAPVAYLRILAALIAAGGAAQVVARALGDPTAGMAAAGMVDAAIRTGEGWRLLTPAFLHGNLIHFAVNFLALLSLGRETEVLSHRAFLPLVFLMAAVAGSLASFLAPPDVPSVGSSGGLMGLIGFLGVLGYRRRERVPSGFLNTVVLNVAVIGGIGLVGVGVIDNAAHAGGLLAGALLGAIFVPTTLARPAWTPGRGVVAAGNAALAVLALGSAWTVAAVLVPVLG